MKEKLIKLLDETFFQQYEKRGLLTAPHTADHLIANGVTFATDNNVGSRWIPVTERLPENDYGKHWKERARYNVIVNGIVATATFGFRNRDWWVDHRGYVFDKEHYNEVTHWRPAPEALKEVE